MATESEPKTRRPKAFTVKPKSRMPSPSTPKFVKLKSLKCYPEINQRILDGWPLSQIAKFIQNDRHEYTDVTPGSLVAVLHEFRGTIPAAKLVSKQPGMLPVFGKAIDEVREGLNELDELEKLYLIQMERINFDFEKERTIKKMLTTMTPEIRAAKDILMARAQLKLDLGIDKRDLGTAGVDVTVTTEDISDNYASESVKKVLASDSSRRKILGVAERFLALAKEGKTDTLGKIAADLAVPVAEVASALKEPLPAKFQIVENPDVDLDVDPDAYEYPKDAE